MIPNIRFTAIDFETASASRSSCCSIGLIYWDGFTESKWSTLVNPGNIQFTNSHIHNITKRSVQNQPTFADVFETLNSYINKSDFVVAHNAQFDRSVLTATCHKNLINISEPPWFCTRVASTKISKAISHDLESIAKRLGIKFTHHDAQEDAEACYKIFCKFLQKAGDWDKLLAKVGFIKRLQNTTFRAAPREMQISAKDISKFMNQLHNENRGPIEDLLIQSYHDFRDTWSPDIDYKNIAFKKDSQNALIDLRDYCAGYLSFLPTYKKLISEIDHDFLVGHALFNVLKIANAQGQLNEIYELLGSCKKYANKPDFLILENGKISIRPRDKSCVIDTEFTNPRTPKFDLFASRKFLCGTVLDVATMQSQTFIDPAAMINRIYEYDTIYSYNGEGFDFALLSQFGLHVNEAECEWIKHRNKYTPVGKTSIDVLDLIRRAMPKCTWWQSPQKLYSVERSFNKFPTMHAPSTNNTRLNEYYYKSIIDCALVYKIIDQGGCNFSYINLNTEIKDWPIKNRNGFAVLPDGNARWKRKQRWAKLYQKNQHEYCICNHIDYEII